MSTLELFTTDWRELWQGAASQEPVGAIFTRPEIVDLILDLAGYSPATIRLAELTVLEPSCGDGAFLETIVARLLESERIHKGSIDWAAPELDSALRAADISLPSLVSARGLIRSRLIGAACPEERAEELAAQWTIHTDFLLHDWGQSFSLVVGNPPYVRLEDLPKAVLEHYRRSFSTATDRADLYVAFIQRGLQLLAPDGVLAFICANRFAKNQYGASLRRLIARSFRVRHFVNLEHTQPFAQEVSAYPAIVVIDRRHGKPTHAATLEDLSAETLATVRREALIPSEGGHLVSTFASWYEDGSPWRTTSRAAYDFLASLEAGFPVLEASGPNTRVGIGVATGADPVFVLDAKDPDIEESRQIPLLMAQDVRLDAPNWSGHYLLNPFASDDDGSLVDLGDFPGLRRHFERTACQLRKRHVARTRPASWYRTIDRIWPTLQFVPKLVLPDIQSGGVVGLDPGQYYPHHNLYWVASDSWSLRALQALLRSTFVLLQVKAYSVHMRGGSLRYQAQTLRRLRVPLLASLSSECASELEAAATSRDQEVIDAAASTAYQLSVPV
jgi:hypothetical protein